MCATGFTAADDQGELLLEDVLDYFCMVQGVLVYVDGTPAAYIVFVDRNNANADLTLQVGFISGLGPWFADNFVIALLLTVGVLSGQVHCAISFIQATE